MTEIQWQYVKVTYLNTRHKSSGEWDIEYIRGSSSGRAFQNAAEFINNEIKASDHKNLSARLLSRQEVAAMQAQERREGRVPA